MSALSSAACYCSPFHAKPLCAFAVNLHAAISFAIVAEVAILLFVLPDFLALLAVVLLLPMLVHMAYARASVFLNVRSVVLDAKHAYTCHQYQCER